MNSREHTLVIINSLLAANMVSIDGVLTSISDEALKKMANFKVALDTREDKDVDTIMGEFGLGKFEVLLKSEKTELTFYNVVNAKILGGDDGGTFMIFCNNNGVSTFVPVAFHRLSPVYCPAAQAGGTPSQAADAEAETGERLSRLDKILLSQFRKIDKLKSERESTGKGFAFKQIDWQQEVANGKTELGYWWWLVNKLEDRKDRDDLEGEIMV